MRLYRDPAEAATRIPTLRMLGQDPALLQDRAERLRASLADILACGIEDSTGYAGGGTLPDSAIPSRAVVVQASLPAEELGRRLRAHGPAVVGRLAGGRLLLDILAVDDAELPVVAGALRDAVAA